MGNDEPIFDSSGSCRPGIRRGNAMKTGSRFVQWGWNAGQGRWLHGRNLKKFMLSKLGQDCVFLAVLNVALKSAYPDPKFADQCRIRFPQWLRASCSTLFWRDFRS